MAADALQPLNSRKWDEKKAKHLLSRAGFGIPRERVTHLAQIGLHKAVDALVEFDSVPQYGQEPAFLLPSNQYRTLRDIEDEDERRKARQRIQRAERQSVQLLKQWWFDRILNSPRPLEEKMTLFWHGHFATSAQKVKNSTANYMLHSDFRSNAVGNFKELTIAVAKSPAMLRYLDNTQNVKEHPNENWARELMELFTLGIGNYTEDDIKESARAFTGWTIGRNGFYIRNRVHDEGSKTFLGHTGNLDGLDVIDIIFEQPATAQFLSRKLYLYFVGDDIDDAVIKAIASDLRTNNYDLAPTLKKLFLSKAFYSERAIGTQIKSPVQFVAQLVHDLDMPYPPYASMARASAQLGQDLFYPPNVKGWDGGRTWINANTLLTRYNLSTTIASANGHKEMMQMQKGMEAMPGMMSPEIMQQGMRKDMDAYMLTLPRHEQAKIRNRIRGFKTQQERSRYVSRLIDKSKNYEYWNAKQVFDDLTFKTAQECVDALVSRFLALPVSRDQQTLIAEALGVVSGLSSPLKHSDLDDAKMNAALHLLLSTAEYQLT